jgi:hypothetical protein
MTDETAQAILALPDDGKFVHRKMIWQGDWTDADIATYAELKRMATFWLMRKEIIEELKADTEAYGHYYLAPPDRQAFAAKIEALEAEC